MSGTKETGLEDFIESTRILPLRKPDGTLKQSSDNVRIRPEEMRVIESCLRKKDEQKRGEDQR